GSRNYGAIEGFVEGLYKVLVIIGGDVEPVVLFGQALCVEYARLAHPRVILGTVTDDVDGQLRRGRMQLSAKIAGRSATGLLTVGQKNNHPRLVAIVQDVRRLLDGRGERRAPGRRQGINLPHDAL